MSVAFVASATVPVTVTLNVTDAEALRLEGSETYVVMDFPPVPTFSNAQLVSDPAVGQAPVTVGFFVDFVDTVTAVTCTSVALPTLVATVVVKATALPAFAVELPALTSTLSLGVGVGVGLGDAGVESAGGGDGVSSAEADAPPAARMAAAPSPAKIGFTAGRQYTAPAPPSHRL
ncbi:hypothetical protein [Actinomadura sp. NTSP31]|uniref:hypothetical protein n=1 Tax=Actinomadura sp. NTSP31 TaxID=1735447 RepID=UPI0035BFDE6B